MENLVKQPIKTFKDLEVYQASFELMKDIYKLTLSFPKEELYSLAQQMRNASRSIPANIAEGWSKRKYVSVFKRHLMDSLGSCNEMLVWLDVALSCQYIQGGLYERLILNYQTLAKRLYQLHDKWKSFK